MGVLDEANDRELVEEVQGTSTGTKQLLRERAKADLYFLSKGILGRKDLIPRVHAPLCRFFEDRTKHRRACLYPRGHLKTTLGTVDDCVRIVLNNPESRILIANEVIDNASDMLSEIKGHFEKEDGMLNSLFPELLPKKRLGPGSDWGYSSATVNREGTYKEPTWLAMGVGGAVTSKHFTDIKLDDVVGLEANRSKAELKHAIKWFNNLLALIIGDIGDTKTIIDLIGTRWGRYDFYRSALLALGPSLVVIRRGCYDANGEVLWRERFSKEFFQQLLDTDPLIFYAQWLNDPVSEEALDFSLSNVQFYEYEGNSQQISFGEADKKETRSISELDRVMILDPNSGSVTAPDEAAINCSGIDHKNNVFVLEEWGGRPTPTKYIEKAFAMACKWRPRIIGVEQAGQQNTLHYLREHCKSKGQFFNVVPVKPDNKEKHDRIRTFLEPLITSRRYFMHKSMHGLIAQVSNFPDTDLDDRIDAAAYAPKLLRTPYTEEDAVKAQEIIDELLKERNQLTGY